MATFLMSPPLRDTLGIFSARCAVRPATLTLTLGRNSAHVQALGHSFCSCMLVFWSMRGAFCSITRDFFAQHYIQTFSVYLNCSS